MTTYNIYDTSLPASWSEEMAYRYSWDLRPEFVVKIIECIFIASAEVLAAAKLKDKPVALVFREPNKQFIAANIVQFFPNTDDPNQPGNWSLVWTFNESDVSSDTQIIDSTDTNVYVYFRSVAGSRFNIEYDSADVINTLNIATILQIKKWLDENAKDNDEVVLSLDGVFQARVAVEGGIKTFALEPAGEIKMLIKDDASIEK